MSLYETLAPWGICLACHAGIRLELRATSGAHPDHLRPAEHPKRFLEQILNDLKSAGIVQSKRGVSGGYRLARQPDQITLASVVRHIEGALAPVSCVSERFYEKCSCPDESRCAIRSVMKEVRDAIVAIVERVTLPTSASAPESFRRNRRAPWILSSDTARRCAYEWATGSAVGGALREVGPAPLVGLRKTNLASAYVLPVPIHRLFQPGLDAVGGRKARAAAAPC